jgi:membrane fusion protein, heavy metal efflux system
MPPIAGGPPLARRLRRWGVLSVFLLLTVAATWVLAHEGHAPLPTRGVQVDLAKGTIVMTRATRDALDLQTAPVTKQPVEERLLAYATLVAPWRNHAFVTSRLTGRIERLLVYPGQVVQAGQPVALVQSTELESFQAELLNANQALQLSSKILEEVQALHKENIASKWEMLEAQTRQRENRSAVDIARSKLKSVGLAEDQLDELLRGGAAKLVRTLTLTAPLSGTVIHTDQTVGKVIGPNEHLVEIVDLSTVWVRIGVLEQDWHRVQVGQSLELRLAAYPRETFAAKVSVKGALLDEKTHLGTVWTELANPPGRDPRFLPGMYGQARIVVARPETLAVPTGAIHSDGAERYVLIEEESTARSGQYRKRPVVVGIQTPALTQLREGDVFPGDRIVTQGGHELAPFFFPGVLRVSPQAAKNIGLRVEPVQRHVVEDILTMEGTVEVPPEKRAVASTRLAGTIQRILVDRGQKVAAGEVVAEVASLELQNLQLELLRVHVQHESAAERLTQLRQAGAGVSKVLPQFQRWELENLYQTTRNRRDSLQRNLTALGLDRTQLDNLLQRKQLVETLPVRAPIAGVVMQFDKALGQVIKAEEPLLEIHDLSQAWIQGFVSEQEFPQVRLGQQVRVRLVADPTFQAEGQVVRSARIFGTENRTLAVWVEVKGQPKGGWQHNLLARLTLTLGKPAPVLAVPQAAVVQEGTRAFIFVQKPDGVFDRRAVILGRADDRYVEITEGLREGESIAVEGTAALQTAFAAVR